MREKLVELLWEYDQMRMMRMSIEECADRLIPKGLTVEKCENDTKCSDLAICLDENAKEKTERIVDLMTSFYGVDPGYYGVEAYPLASHLIAHSVTVQEWIPVSERLPNNKEHDWVLAQVVEDNGYMHIPKVMEYREQLNDWYEETYGWLSKHNGAFIVTHWMPLPEPPSRERNTDGTCK